MIMMIGLTLMHMMHLQVYMFSFFFSSSYVYLWTVEMEYGGVSVDYGALICHICYFFLFLDDELMTKFENFECWIIFSNFTAYGIYGVWINGPKCMDCGVMDYE
ncbi:hypothetical protein AMTRI_Chr06g172370 [Amborella trichopoda]